MKHPANAWLKALLVIAALAVIGTEPLCAQPSNGMKYKNPRLPVETRVEDLLRRMTLEEKFWQLFMIPGDLSEGREKYRHGIFGFQVATRGRSGDMAGQLLDYQANSTATATAALINSMQQYFVKETRLGIPILPFDEALHGLVREGATAFPQAIALAATWDTALVGAAAHAIALETRSRGIRQILSPVVNLATDVRWGRTEETYGEDPFLASRMAVAFVSAFERNGVICTPKHFVANVGDGGRDSYPIHSSERALEETHFPPFRACFQEAGAGSVMTSYNSLDGRPCSANAWLLNQKLKKEWGFRGFAISDAGATGGANMLHFTARDYADATRQAIESGQDVIFQTSYDHYPLFWEAFEKGMIAPRAIDEAVRRVLRAKFKLGLFENPYTDEGEAARWNGNKAHRELAKKVAQKSAVLLKNDHNTLPLSPRLASLAVIGTDAAEARLGGYAGPGNQPVSILQGIRDKVSPGCNVRYAPGCGRKTGGFATVPEASLSHREGGQKIPGLKGEYYNNPRLEGTPALVRVDSRIRFRWTLYSPDPEKINYDWYAARWTGTLTAPETGNFEIGFRGDDGYRLYLDGRLVVDNWKKQSAGQYTAPFHFEKGREYDIRIEFYETVGNVSLELIWNAGVTDDWQEKISEAVGAARQSDAVVLVVGIEEGEGLDRAFLHLPGHQEAMIRAVAAAGKPVVVVLVGGSAVTMTEWIRDVPAVLDVWYPGEAGGHAVADVLFGDFNPAGRLPISFPLHEGQLPLVYNHKPTGRNDDYADLPGKPLFPFGFGLSYTRFTYGSLKFDKSEIGANESTKVRFQLTNAGDYDGEEVVQLYIRDELASVARPVMELKGFRRVFLKKGETTELSFDLTPGLLSMPDAMLKSTTEPGTFRIMIGASSGDIRLRDILRVRG